MDRLVVGAVHILTVLIQDEEQRVNAAGYVDSVANGIHIDQRDIATVLIIVLQHIEDVETLCAGIFINSNLREVADAGVDGKVGALALVAVIYDQHSVAIAAQNLAGIGQEADLVAFQLGSSHSIVVAVVASLAGH